MDVYEARRAMSGDDKRVVARPHLPALLWYGFWAFPFGIIITRTFRIIVWDGSLMMLVPIGVIIAFAVPLFLVIRNLTAVAVLENGTLELRRCFMTMWRIGRSDIYSAIPTRGIIEGPLKLSLLGGGSRSVPGFLLRGLRGTWVETMRNEKRPNPFADMSREEMKAFVDVAHRSTVERDESFGSSPEQRWANWSRWNTEQRIFSGVAIGFGVLALFADGHPAMWTLAILTFVAGVVLGVLARLRIRGHQAKFAERSKGIVYTMMGLAPAFGFTRSLFDWQTLDPGLGTMGFWLAVVVWGLALVPPWRGLTWKERFSSVFLSVLVFGGTALGAYKMICYANMHFDHGRAPVEWASVLRTEEHIASRSSPASLDVDLGGTPTLTFGVSARFPLTQLPAGQIAVGGSCALVVKPGWLHVRWVKVYACRPR